MGEKLWFLHNNINKKMFLKLSRLSLRWHQVYLPFEATRPLRDLEYNKIFLYSYIAISILHAHRYLFFLVNNFDYLFQESQVKFSPLQ